MKELLEAAFLAVNIPYTFLLFLTLGYWLIVAFGLLDTEFLDFDVDVDADIDVDVDADVDVDGGSDFSFANVLHFFNFGEVPFMIIFSFLSLSMWASSMIINDLLGNISGLIALGLAIPIFIGCLFITKYVTLPFVSIYRKMNHEEDTSVIGKICEVTLQASDEKKGQAKLITGKNNHQLINVLSISENTILNKGEKAVVVEYQNEKNYYLVERFIS